MRMTRVVLERTIVGDIVEWRKWVPFLPVLVASYYKRYTQHFSVLANYPSHTPVARNFYEQPWMIDGGSMMYKRLLDRDKNVILLLNFGWRVVDNRLLPPPSFVQFVESFYTGIEFIAGDRSLDSLPIPAIQFTRKNKTGDCLEDNKFVRMGIDDAPDPEEWELVTADENGLIDVPLDLFSHVFCRNCPPMNVIMFDHDMAHVVDNINNPEYYEANQTVFARVCGKHPSKSKLYISEDPSSGNPFTTYGRICGLHEELCLPDIHKSWGGRKIEDLLDDLYGMPDLKQKGSLLATFVPRLTSRHGGGVNDPYNLHNDLNIRTTPRQRVDCFEKNRAQYLFRNKGRELFSQLAIESILGMTSDIEYLCTQSGTEHEEMLEDRCWRVETAMREAVELHITPDRFAHETTDQFVDPNCDSFKWLNSFMPKYSLTAKFYLSSDAIGFPI